MCGRRGKLCDKGGRISGASDTAESASKVMQLSAISRAQVGQEDSELKQCCHAEGIAAGLDVPRSWAGKEGVSMELLLAAGNPMFFKGSVNNHFIRRPNTLGRCRRPETESSPKMHRP